MSVTFYKPTEEEIAQRLAELKKRKERGEPCLNIGEIYKFARMILTNKRKTDICFSWIKHYQDFSVYSKEEMTAVMTRWKTLAKEGKLSICEENNTEFDVEGKTIYCLVITPLYEIGTSLCPFALSLGMIVSGYTYAYTKKVNRDAIYAYIKKNCTVEIKNKK